MIVIPAFLLTACAGSIDSASGPTEPLRELTRAEAQPPAALLKDCPRPGDLPDRDLSAGEVERLWGADRVSLSICGKRHKALKSFYRHRDRLLSGE